MGINGEGIGYDHGVPVFIPGALMHETVDVKITQEKEKYKTAKLIRVIRKSKDRVEPECRYCDSCRACTLMHLKYERQLNYKKQTLKQALKKYADIDMPVSIIKNDNIYHYRNKFKLPFGMENAAGIISNVSAEKGIYPTARASLRPANDQDLACGRQDNQAKLLSTGKKMRRWHSTICNILH